MIDAFYAVLGRLGFTDPLHPAIVHIPVGLIIGALIFFLIAIIFKRRQLVLTARHLSILALVFAFPTILFGVFDWIHFYHGVLFPAIKIKIYLAGLLLILLGLGIILGGETKPHRALMTGIYALSVISVVALGYFGGSIVFGHGASAVAASSIGVSQGAPASPSRTKVPEGQALFETNCISCHVGGGNVVEPKLPVRGSAKLASLAGFQAFLRAPAMPNGKAGAMPAFDDASLDADHVKELYQYLVDEYK